MGKQKMTVYIDGSRRSERVLEEIKKKFGDKYHIERVYCGSPSEKIPAVSTVTSLIEGYDNVCRYILGGAAREEKKYLVELGMPEWTLEGSGLKSYTRPIEIFAGDDKEACQEVRRLLNEKRTLGQKVPGARISKVVDIIIE